MKNNILIILSLFAILNCKASNTKNLDVYYSMNQSFNDIIDSICSIQNTNGQKTIFQKQDFYIFMNCKNDSIYMYISQCRLIAEEFNIKYKPFGCVIKNDSFFYLINVGCNVNQIMKIFHKTSNKIIPTLIKGQKDKIDMKKEPVFFVYRRPCMFKLKDDNF